MPLSLEGKIICAQRKKDEDKYFLERYGEEKFQNKLDLEGVFAYSFFDDSILREVTHEIFFKLRDEVLYGDSAELEKYRDYLQRSSRRMFSFQYFSPHILSAAKPFPDLFFRNKLEQSGIQYEKVPVYRIADLSEEEIRHRLGGGVWWLSEVYIDLSGNLTRWRESQRRI